MTPLKPFFIQIKKPPQAGRPTKGEVAVTQAKLPTAGTQVTLCLQEQDNGGSKTRAIGSSPAMQNERIFATVQHLDQTADFRRGRKPTRRKANVFLGDVPPVRSSAFVEVPRPRDTAAT
jgi:hypothetical protein